MNLQIPRHVLIVQLVGHPTQAAPSANAARRVKKPLRVEDRGARSVPNTSTVKVTREIVMVYFFHLNPPIPRHVLSVQRVGDRTRALERVPPSATLAMPAGSPTTYWIQRTAKIALTVPKASIVKVKRRMVSPSQIRRNALIVPQDGRPKEAAPDVKLVERVHLATVVNRVQ